MALLLLMYLLPASQPLCQLKDNVEDLLIADYASVSEDQTEMGVYVDEIVVKIKEGEKWENLLKDVKDNSCDPRREKVIVHYRRKGEALWQEDDSIRMSDFATKYFQIENLDPCETYQVKVNFSLEALPIIYDVGPYYNQTSKQEYLGDQENKYYLKYKDSPSEYVNVTGFERSSAISVSGICAKTVVLHVYKDVDEVAHENVEVIYTNPKSKRVQIGTIEGLEPCTLYHLNLEMYLRERLDETTN